MKVLYFAHLKSATGCGEEEFPLGSSVDVEGLWDSLLNRHPSLSLWRNVARLARNGEYAEGGTRFSDADEVALIPPVSGG
jgi:molybdopterin converting factor subunit 1